MPPARALALILPAIVAGFLLPSSVVAQSPSNAPLDPEVDQAYPWRVVVQTRPHPLLTPDARDRLCRTLGDSLRAGLGPLGTVEVIDLAATPRTNWEPLWQQFDDAGFPALDAPRELTGVKTHFLRVEYHDGEYRLEARQHDGFTGLASPLTRRSRVRDPGLLARAAGLLLDRDFGPGGTIEPVEGRKDEVRVRLRGGRRGSFERHVQLGDVFAVATIRRTARPSTEPVRTATGKIVTPSPGSGPRPALHPELRPFTYLQVVSDPQNGACTCTVLTRFRDPFPPGPTVAGFRCLKLTTAVAPVAVRVVRGDGRLLDDPRLRVWATETRVITDPKDDDRLPYLAAEGLFRSARPQRGVVYVVVGGQAGAQQFPVPVLGPDPVVLPFELNEAAEDRAAYERAVRAVYARATEARAAQDGCFAAVAKLIEARNNKEALARATAGFRAADATATALTDEAARLREDLHKSPDAAGLLDGVDRQVADLRDGNAVLGQRIKDLDAVVARETGPAADGIAVQADAVNVRIGILIARGDIDEAIAAYGQLVTLLPNDPEVKARREKLKAEWEPKGPEHKAAREYLFQTWPRLATLADIKAGLGDFAAAAQTCQANGDRHGLRKLLSSLRVFDVKMVDLIKTQDPATEAGRQGLADAKAIRDAVGMVEQQTQEFLRQPAK